MACTLEGAVSDYLRNIESTSISNPLSFLPCHFHSYTQSSTQSIHEKDSTANQSNIQKALHVTELLEDAQKKAFDSLRRQSNKRCSNLQKQIDYMLGKKNYTNTQFSHSISINCSSKSEPSVDYESSFNSPTKESGLTAEESDLKIDNCHKKKCIDSQTNAKNSLMLLKSLFTNINSQMTV